MAWRRLCREVVVIVGVSLTLSAPAGAQTPAPADDQYGQPAPTRPTDSTPPTNQPGVGDQKPESVAGGDGEDEPGVDVRGERETGTVGSRRESGGDPVSSGGLPLAESRGGDLPFTGLDIAALVFIALALLAAGTLLRALTRRRAAETR